MQKMFLFVIVVTLAACKDAGTGTAPKTDTILEWRENLNMPAEVKATAGEWAAEVAYSAAGAGTIVVTGMVEPEKPGATITLIKAGPKRQMNPGELVLNLTKRPAKKMAHPVKVEYTEELQRQGQYMRVQILYNDKPVAFIGKVADKNNKK